MSPRHLQVPRVLNLLSTPSPDLRALAVSTLNQLANIMPAALINNMDRWGAVGGCGSRAAVGVGG